MASITYHTINTEEPNLPKDAIQKWLEELEKSNKKEFTINYIFCNDDEILKINKTHLNHDYFTDIITFDLSAKNSNHIISDIFISTDTVLSNCKLENTNFANEIIRVITHGVFHLLNFKDKTEEEKTKMRQLENEAIEQILT